MLSNGDESIVVSRHLSQKSAHIFSDQANSPHWSSSLEGRVSDVGAGVGLLGGEVRAVLHRDLRHCLDVVGIQPRAGHLMQTNFQRPRACGRRKSQSFFFDRYCR